MKDLSMRFQRGLIASVLVLCLSIAGVVSAEGAKPGEEVVKDFIAHVNAAESLSDTIKKQVRDTVQQLREDEYSQIEAITIGLTLMYPEYEKAINATQSDNVEDAINALRPHIDSDDSFLAADASFYMARSLMNVEQHENALPLLENLSDKLAEYTLHAGPAVYFRGVAQANLLENQRAIKSFAKFLESYPDSPERLRVAAWRQIQMIQSIKEGAMDDILQRMDFSRRRLQIERTDDVTQDEQEKIITMLAKLIREQEKKECSNCNSKKNCKGQQEGDSQKPGEGQGEGKSNQGGTSNNPNGKVTRKYGNGPASPWSVLRERSREAANSAIKQKLPARYRNVVEKYYDVTSGNSDDSKK